MSNGKGPFKTPLSAIGALVALVGILAVVIVGLSITHSINASSTPLVTSIIVIVSTAAPSLLGTLKNEQLHNDIKNGLIPQKVKEGINEIINEDSPNNGSNNHGR